ncbi:hypothetical protein [Gluconobacter thailandicus]|uniref:hypothetical protein n=1 Tax=Gluconobacter thailandicus TaxID=257438 RepID=UPI000AD1A3A3|nr:hypothetical protein [Gluconobacter thailandicus]
MTLTALDRNVWPGVYRWLAFMKWLALFMIVGALSNALSFAGDGSDCVTAPIVLPLLGGEGDAPLIPVTVNGKRAAMYVSPSFDSIYVRNAQGITFPDGGEPTTVLMNGTYREQASRSRIDKLVLDETPLKNVDVIRLDTPSTQVVDGRPVVGVLRRTALSSLAILLDIPERQFAYLDFSNKEVCKGTIDGFLGKDSHSAEMEDDFTVHIRIETRKKRVSFDPDLTYTTFPSFWMSSLKDNLQVLETQKKFTHYDRFMSVGQAAQVRNLFMGGVPIRDEKVLFQDEVDIGNLGLPFFADKVILWSLGRNRLYFVQPAHIKPMPKGQSLHFFATHSGSVAVRDGSGTVQ